MKSTVLRFKLIALLMCFTSVSFAQCNNLLDFESKRLHSKKIVNFCDSFAGKTLLVVNTASRCGFTPQFKQLEALYQKYKSAGLEIVGFPSNSFRQELSEESKTAEVCYKNYGVTFSMLAPSDVTGPEANPFYKKLATKVSESPNWNFNKYLLSADLSDIRLYRSNVAPLNSSLEQTVSKFLGL